jgi:hypothetical protein
MAEKRAAESAMGGTPDLMRCLGTGEPKALELLRAGRVPGAFQIGGPGSPWKIPKPVLAGIADGSVSILPPPALTPEDGVARETAVEREEAKA